MKKFLLVLAVLPFLAFGNVYLYSYNSDLTVSVLNVPIPSQIVSLQSSDYTNLVYSIYYNNFNGYYYSSKRGYLAPLGTSSVPTNPSPSTIDYQILVAPGIYCNPLFFPNVAKLYFTVESLYSSGYRSPGLVVLSENSNVHYVNFNFSQIVSDVFSSTNNAYQSLVLSALNSIHFSLSSIGSSVQNVQVDLGQFQSDYSFVNASHFGISNVIDYAASDSVIPSRLATSLKNMARDPSNYDYIHSVLDSYRSAQWLPLAFSDSDLASPLHNDSRVKQGLKNLGDSFGAGSSYHYTTPLTNELQKLNTNWVSEAKAALSNNTFQITNQLAHMFDDIPNSLGRAIRDTANNTLSTANAAGSIDQRLANGITVAVVNQGNNSVAVHLDGPVNIDQTQFNSLSVPLGSLQRSVSDWYSDWYDFFRNGSQYRWGDFVDYFLDFKSVNHTDLVSLQSCISNLLLSLHGDITNSVVSTNGYLLLSDYADYIHSGGLDTLLDVMDDDAYSDLKSEIDSLYHADAAEGYGRWWRYFTGLSTVQANGIFKLSNIFQAHEKLLTDLKRDNSDLDVQDASDPSVFRKLLYTIPSEEDTFNKLAQLTNSIDQSGMVRVQSLIPDLTNRLNVAASLFDKDFSLPTEISWELIPADPSINSRARIVTIRPYDHYRLFQMLHYGLAFSYCLVNLILFPKFLLLLVRLFDRVWNKSEKLIYNSTQS